MKEALERIYNLIDKAFNLNNYGYIREAFEVACDYNSKNYGESEIFMSEDDDYVMVGDDVFYFEGRF